MSTRHALVVGINGYPGGNTLNGCLNDADAMQSLLRLRGYEVVTLVDDMAKAQTIESTLRALLNDLHGPGDALVFSYSGHGAQVRDLDGDEPDALDETLVPIDFAWDRPSTWFTDDRLHGVLKNAAPGVTVLCNFDSCHAGTMLRDAPAPMEVRTRRRCLLSPHGIEEVPPLAWWRHLPLIGGLTHRPFGTRFERAPVDAHVALLAATKPKQLAADAWIGGSYHGAHTYALTRIVSKLPGLPLREVVAAMTGWLHTHGYGGTAGQTPTLYGSAWVRRRPFGAVVQP